MNGMTWRQAMTIANIRARNTGIRQRVTPCICRNPRHFMVRPVEMAASL